MDPLLMSTRVFPWKTRAVVAALLAACGMACASPGKYVWADDYPDNVMDNEKAYAIAPGDVIQIRVFNQEQLSTRGKVRADGKISLPLLNDVVAAGMTPVELANSLQGRLKDFVKSPLVTVSLEETRPLTVYVGGEVAKPGVYPLDIGGGVLQSIVNAGGLTQNASYDRIFVLRQGSPPVRIRFTYNALVHLIGRAAVFKLRPGDVVVVE
jgi:polysaccharide export outer membrane protein